MLAQARGEIVKTIFDSTAPRHPHGTKCALTVHPLYTGRARSDACLRNVRGVCWTLTQSEQSGLCIRDDRHKV